MGSREMARNRRSGVINEPSHTAASVVRLFRGRCSQRPQVKPLTPIGRGEACILTSWILGSKAFIYKTRVKGEPNCVGFLSTKKKWLFSSQNYPSVIQLDRSLKWTVKWPLLKCIDVLKCDLGSEFHIYIYMHSEFVPKIVNRANTCVFDCMHFWTLCTRISKIRLSVHWNYKYN